MNGISSTSAGLPGAEAPTYAPTTGGTIPEGAGTNAMYTAPGGEAAPQAVSTDPGVLTSPDYPVTGGGDDLGSATSWAVANGQRPESSGTDTLTPLTAAGDVSGGGAPGVGLPTASPYGGVPEFVRRFLPGGIGISVNEPPSALAGAYPGPATKDAAPGSYRYLSPGWHQMSQMQCCLHASTAPGSAACGEPLGTSPGDTAPAGPVDKPRHEPAPRTYTVAKGDTLSKIADKFGTTWQKLYAANRSTIDNPNLIYPGEVLRIPGSGDSATKPKPKPKPADRTDTGDTPRQGKPNAPQPVPSAPGKHEPPRKNDAPPSPPPGGGPVGLPSEPPTPAYEPPPAFDDAPPADIGEPPTPDSYPSGDPYGGTATPPPAPPTGSELPPDQY